MNRKVGRPPKEIKRDEQLKVRVTPEEKKRVEDLAKKSGETISDLVRGSVLGFEDEKPG